MPKLAAWLSISFAILLGSGTPSASAQEAIRDGAPSTTAERIESYEPERDLAGFKVRVHGDLTRDEPVLRDEVLATLERDLRMIRRTLSNDAVMMLGREVTFWVELQGRKVDGGMSGRGMCYHASAPWLAAHGILVDKTGGVEICRAADFIPWRGNQPWMVLHELAHAYHARLPAWALPYITRAYERAKAAGTYEAVAYNLAKPGETRRAYALNNDREYFAELTEAYFGRNDFGPYDRGELRALDPEGCAMIERVWFLTRDERESDSPPDTWPKLDE